MGNDIKFDFDFSVLESGGCPICNSPLHKAEDCVQIGDKESKFRFPTRKELGVAPGSLPFKFRVDIDPEHDDETEIIRKRSLLRLNSNKVYNLMGIAVKAQETQKAALDWVFRLVDELDIDDPTLQEEKNKLLPLIATLQTSLRDLTRIRQDKIKQAEQMEEFVTKAGGKAREARTRLAARKAKKQKEKDNFWVMPNPNLNTPMLLTDNEGKPVDLIEAISNAIVRKEGKSDPE